MCLYYHIFNIKQTKYSSLLVLAYVSKLPIHGQQSNVNLYNKLEHTLNNRDQIKIIIFYNGKNYF